MTTNFTVMIESAFDVLLSLAVAYGPAILFGVFVLEGALIGKVIPTRTLFVAVALAVGTSTLSLVSVALAAVAGATIGQCLLFVAVRRTDYSVDAFDTIDGVASGRPSTGRAEAWFDRWGVSAVALSNSLPFVRGSLTIPTAFTSVSPSQFSVYSLAGTVIYVGGLTALATGANEAVSILL